jgi:hypothetical protein
MNGSHGHRFYDMAERDAWNMVDRHYCMSPTVRTEFSSWASSLQLVLCYARSMPAGSNAHVAVVDRERLDSEVLI